MRDRRRSLAWRTSMVAATTGAALVMGTLSAQAAPVPTPAPSPSTPTTAQLPHWNGPAPTTSQWKTPATGGADALADLGGAASTAEATAEAAANNATAAAASTDAPDFAPGQVNRTVVGATPTQAWTPPAAATGDGTAAQASKSPSSSTSSQRQSTPPSATQAPSGQLSTLANPTTGFPGAGASGAGLGVQSFYGMESFDFTSSLTGGVNVANGNLVIRNQAMAYNAPGLSVNLDVFFNALNTSAGSLSYGGSLSTGQDIGLQVAASTVTFYGPSGFTGVFTANGSGGWTAPAGVNADLVRNADQTWSLTYRASAEKLTFTSGGYLIKDVDRNGVGLTLSYDSSNRMSSLTDANGRVTTFTYGTFGITKITDPVGRSFDVAYYPGGGIKTMTDAAGAVTAVDNTRTGGLDGIQTPNGNWTYFTYDSASRVTSVTRYLTPGAKTGDAAVTSFAYNTSTGASASTRQTSPTGGITTYAADSSGRVTSVTDPLGRMRSQTWTPNSDLATATDAAGVAGTGGGAGTAGNITTYSYDTLNNRTAVASPTGAATRASYAAGTGTTGTAYQPKTSTDAAGNTSALTYDAAGNTLSVRDTTGTAAGGTGAVTSAFTYQDAVVSATTSPTQCGGKAGQVCTSTDGNGNVTTYRYDAMGNLTQVTPAAPLGATTYTYDTAGRVTSVTDGKGQKTQYVYDAADRVTKTTFAGGATLTNDYDSDGNLTVSVDSAGGSSYFEYDALDRQVWMSQPNFGGNGFGSDYDKAGNLTRVDDLRGVVTYAYDAANQLTSMTEPSGSGTDTISFTYDRNGAEATRTLPGGLVQTTTRDNAGRATRIKATVGTYVITDLGYSYTAPGGSGATGDRALVQSRTDYAGTTAPAGSVTAYGHDGLNRLTSARETTPTGGVNASWTYTYDKAGNRTGTTTTGATKVGATAATAAASTTWGYNGANQATSRNSSTTGWAYDANGNQTSAPTWGTGAYDKRDALASATPTGSSTATAFAYLGAGNGTRQQAGTGTDLNGPLGLAGLIDGGSYHAYRYTPDGRIISTGLPNGTNRWYLSDNLGNVTTMVSDSAVTAAYSYDPYGTLRSITGVEAADNAFRYGQGYTDFATGLVKLGIRYYDTNQGRFTQLDPTGQDPHYMYAAGCPSTYNDPSGAAAGCTVAAALVVPVIAYATKGAGTRVAASAAKSAAARSAAATSLGGAGTLLSCTYRSTIGKFLTQPATGTLIRPDGSTVKVPLKQR